MDRSVRGRPSISRVAGIGTVLVLIAWLAVWATESLVMELPITFVEFFNLNLEANLPMWWTTSMLLVVALLAAGAAALDEPGTRPAWWLVTAAALYFSLDEGSGIHEMLAYLRVIPALSPSPFLWVIPGAVLVVVGVMVLVIAGRRLPRRVALRLAGALGVYLGGALGVETVSAVVRETFGRESPQYLAAYFVEEGLEMAACVLAITALAAHLGGLPSVAGGEPATVLRSVLPTSPGRRAVLVGAAGWVVLCGLCVVTQLLLTGNPRHPVEDLFDIQRESTVPTWWQWTLMLLVAGACAVAASHERQPRVRRAWITAAVVAVLFSLDEAAMLHERLGRLPGMLTLGAPTSAWIVPGLVVTLALPVVVGRLGRPLPQPTRRRLGLALGFFLTGAVVGQAVVGALELTGQAGAVFPVSMLEEALELVGLVLALHTVISHLEAPVEAASEAIPATGS